LPRPSDRRDSATRERVSTPRSLYAAALMSTASLAVSVLAYRSADTIERCVASVLALESAGPIHVVVREQGGDDAEYELLRRLQQRAGLPPGRSLEVTRGANLGFAAGHNDAIRRTASDLVLILNADAHVDPMFLVEAANAFDDSAVAAVQGKVLRWMPGTDDRDSPPVIDTTGLQPTRDRRFVNRGQGEPDTGPYDEPDDVWGVDGAVMLLRRAALEDVGLPCGRDGVWGAEREYFDEDFFAHKEDVDLAWRLQLGGWRSAYVPAATAWHVRATRTAASGSLLDRWRERRQMAGEHVVRGFGNQRLLQLKNERVSGLVRDLPAWLPKEAAAWLVLVSTERGALAAISRFLRLVPRALRKRKWIQARAGGRDGLRPWLR
jgi:GT2 family glycosyltransferase